MAAPVAVCKDGTTIITAGASTPISYGAVSNGDAALSHTFTVANTGDATLTITSVTKPTGFTINAASGVPGTGTTIAAASSKTLIVDLATAVLGTKSGNVTVNSDDGTNAAYAWAIHGEVVAAGDGGKSYRGDARPIATLGSSEPNLGNYRGQQRPA